MQMDLFGENVQIKGRIKKHIDAVANRTTTNKHKSVRLKEEHVFPMHNIVHKKETCTFLKQLLDLTKDYSISQILYCIGANLLGKELEEYKNLRTSLQIDIPQEVAGEFDLIGTAYQYLTPKFNRLNQGSFYTSQSMITDILKDVIFSKEDSLFDPACGSGNLLLARDIDPSKIYGIDNDPIAIMCCKINYYLKYGKNAPSPHIYCTDFITFIGNNTEHFSYVICNPPFGATICISSLYKNTVETEDSLTYFVEHCANISSKKSIFILPESVMNVKKHDVLRKWLLDNTNISAIQSYGANFSGTMFPIVVVTIRNNTKKTDYFVFDDKKVSKKATMKMPFFYFRPIGEKESAIIEKVFSKKTQSLKGSIFALGIVTGGNKDKLLDEAKEGAEPIITGKDLSKYEIGKTKKWLVFDRKNLQQVAPTALYRAKEKLIYKVVSHEMIFAIDTEQRLTLNSANFIIPQGLTISNKCLLALFNSELYGKLNNLLYGENKISRTNLENLPLPNISLKDQRHIESLIDQRKYTEIDRFIYKLFDM